MMETAVALERYRRAQGAFPSSLEQLVPEYLEAVPEDLGAPVPGTPVSYTLRADGYELLATTMKTHPDGRPIDELKFIR